MYAMQCDCICMQQTIYIYNCMLVSIVQSNVYSLHANVDHSHIQFNSRDRRKTKITHLIPFNILHHLWLQKLASTGTDRVHLLEGEREKSYFLRERTLLSFYGWLLYFFHDEYMMLLLVNTPRTPLSAKLVEDVWNSSFLTFKLFVDVKCSVSGFLLNQIELSAESMFACK